MTSLPLIPYELLRQMPDAVLLTDLEGTIIDWLGNSEIVFGYSADEAAGRPLTFLYSGKDHGPEISRIIGDIRKDGQFREEIRCRRKDGADFQIEIRARIVSSGPSQEVLLAVCRDSSLERRLGLLVDASGKLLGSLEIDKVLPGILDLSRQLIDAEAYAVWRNEPESGLWRAVCSFGLPEDYPKTTQAWVPGGFDFTGTLQVEDVEGLPLLANRQEFYRSSGIRALLVVPLKTADRISGTITFYYTQPRRFAATDVRVATALANLAAAAIGIAEMAAVQARSRAQAEEAHHRSAFLAEAGNILGSSLNYESTLGSVAKLAVPEIADWCMVDVVSDDGALKQVALAHADPRKIEWAKELAKRYPADPDAPTGAPNVMRTGEPELTPEITDEMLVAAARDAEHLAILRQVGFTSWMCVPMVARGRTLGTIALVSTESRKRFGTQDLELAEELAKRAALAVDNARLYAQARRESAALETALTALRDSEARFRRVVESDMIGILFADSTGRITGANDAFLRMLGYAREDLEAGLLDWASLTPPEHRAADERARGEQRTRGVSAPYEKELIRRDGMRLPVLIGTAVLHTEAQSTVAFALDLSQRKATETALRENEERLRLALEAGRMGIWDWNVETNGLKWTELLEPIHGFAPGTFGGTLDDFLRVVHPEDRHRLESAIAAGLAEGVHFEAEFRVIWPDNSIHWVLGTGQGFCNENGKPVRMIGVGMDITDRKLLEEKLRQSQKLESVGLLAGGIAHDFNNLLTGILGNASLAMEILGRDNSASSLLDDVVSASERAAELTNQLLAYSGKGRFVLALLDLSAVVHDMSSLIQVTMPKMVHLRLDLATALPPIEADQSQIQQVIMNLVMNGAEAIGERPGTVLVKTGLVEADAEYIRREFPAGDLGPGTFVYMDVQDTGTGMDSETQERIFDPFFTTKFTGRGLGLAAVSGVVRGHRGAIRVSSALGQGSTFRVMFPAVRAGSGVHPQTSLQAAPAPAETVLVIDDEEVVRRTVEMALTRAGYRVLAAQDGSIGVQVFRQYAREIALVLLDMAMPVMSGEEAIRHIREIRPEVPVLATSGYSETEASRRFAPYRIAGFIQKPYTAGALVSRVKATLEQHGKRGLHAKTGTARQ